MARLWRYLEALIQALVLSLVGLGWYISVVNIGLEWLIQHQNRRVFGSFYLLLVNALIGLSVTFYLYLCSKRDTHSVSIYPLPDKTTLTEPYPCFSRDGGLRLCNKGNCNSRWAPPRSHHCSTCGVCRLDFDHHCPWIGNCVTIPRLKMFLLLLTIFPLTVLVVIAPITHVLISHAKQAILVSQGNPLTRQYWWDWHGSWVVVCGPPGRWIIGAVLGFWLIQNDRSPGAPSYPGKLIEEPYFRVTAVTFIFIAFALFSISLALLTVRMMLKGSTTLESLGIGGRRRAGLVCIPMEPHTPTYATTNVGERVVPVSVFTPADSEYLFDLGLQANFRRFWQLPIFPEPTPQHFNWPKLNPVMLQGMRSRMDSMRATDN